MRGESKRLPVYIDAELHQAVKVQALLAGKKIYVLVEELLRQALAEEQKELRILRERTQEPVLTYEQLLAELKSHGVL